MSRRLCPGASCAAAFTAEEQMRQRSRRARAVPLPRGAGKAPGRWLCCCKRPSAPAAWGAELRGLCPWCLCGFVLFFFFHRSPSVKGVNWVRGAPVAGLLASSRSRSPPSFAQPPATHILCAFCPDREGRDGCGPQAGLGDGCESRVPSSWMRATEGWESRAASWQRFALQAPFKANKTKTPVFYFAFLPQISEIFACAFLRSLLGWPGASRPDSRLRGRRGKRRQGRGMLLCAPALGCRGGRGLGASRGGPNSAVSSFPFCCGVGETDGGIGPARVFPVALPLCSLPRVGSGPRGAPSKQPLPADEQPVLGCWGCLREDLGTAWKWQRRFPWLPALSGPV